MTFPDILLNLIITFNKIYFYILLFSELLFKPPLEYSFELKGELKLQGKML